MTSGVTTVRGLLWGLALAGSLRAQSVYLDLGGLPPSSSYAAAASAPGVWNASWALGPGSWQPLVDVQGNPTSVELETIWGCDNGFCLGMPGDDGALLGDWVNADCYLVPQDLAFRGLAPGFYRVHVYGHGEQPCGGVGGGTIDFISSTATATMTVGPWAGSFASVNHVAFVARVDPASELRIIVISHFYGGPAGIQLEHIVGEIAPYCLGAEGRCPCASSNGSTSGGCATSFSAAGASLSASGSPTIGNDTLTLTASGMSAAAAVLFQGTTMIAGKSPFGDGLLCTSGTVTRIVLRQAPVGTLVYPAFGDAPISVAGLIQPGGGTRYYQGWFRDSAAFCTTATFNLTSAVAVVWH